MYASLEDLDPTLPEGSSSGSEGSTGSPQYCSTTPLLGSARNSPGNNWEGADPTLAVAVDSSDKDNIESESEEGQ